MNRRVNDASPEPAPHLGVFLVATGTDQDCRPELIRNFLQKNVGSVRIVTSSRSYTNDKTFLTMEFASPGMVKDAIENFNYTRFNGCLLNINRFRSKTMQGRNSFGGFQKGFTVTRDGARQGRVHQTMRGRPGPHQSKQDRDRAMEEKMRAMSPNSAARYIETREHSKRDLDRSRSRSTSSSRSPSRGRGRRRKYSSSRSRSRSDYSHSRSRSRSRSYSQGSGYASGGRRRKPSASRNSRSRSRDRSVTGSRSRSGSRARSKSRSKSKSPSRSRSRSPALSRRSRSRSIDRRSSSPSYRHRRRSRRKRADRQPEHEDVPKVSDTIQAGEVFLTVPLDSLTQEQQDLVQQKRDQMTEEYRQDCSTVVTVARLFTGYSQHLEQELEKTLRLSLAGIGQRYVDDFQSWLKETVPNAVGEFNEGDTPMEAT